MKLMDYSIEGTGAKRRIIPKTERAKQRTPEPLEFATQQEALDFVKAGNADGFRFAGQNFVDRDYKLVRYGYFVDTGAGQLVHSGQDWGPPDPSFEVGDVYPGGPRNGKHLDITAVLTGEAAKKNGVDVMVIGRERDVSKMN